MMRVKEMRVEGRPREKIGKLCVKEPEREKSRGGGLLGEDELKRRPLLQEMVR